MKVEYGSQNLEEENAFIRRVVAPPKRNDNPRRRQKRMVAVGASVVLLAAGAIATYVAMPGENATSMSAETLSSDTKFVIPDEDDNDNAAADYVPPFSQYDTNNDGLVSTAEYLAQLATFRDDAIQRVAEGDISEDLKAEYTARLKRNFSKEVKCVTDVADNDPDNADVDEERFNFFYNMMKEFCIKEDVKIPEPFRPTDMPVDEQIPAEEPTPVQEPEVPQEPSYPEPQVPQEPSYPEPALPEEPTYPGEPVTPEEPTYPGEPTQPEEPTYPGEPVQPEEPTYPGEPVTPEEPTYPGEPTQPEEPTYPGEPVQPEEPTYPGEPVTPEEPSIPENETPTVTPVALYMTKPEFRAKIADHFVDLGEQLAQQVLYADLEAKKAHLLKDLLEECINQATEKFGYYGVYEQDQVFNDALTWITNDCLTV